MSILGGERINYTYSARENRWWSLGIIKKGTLVVDHIFQPFTICAAYLSKKIAIAGEDSGR